MILATCGMTASSMAAAQTSPPVETSNPVAPAHPGSQTPAGPSAENVTVTAARRSPADSARVALEKVPGGTSVVDQKLVAKSRVMTDQDVLAFQPGVYAQSSGGADGLKISIRGSGIDAGTNYFRQGIYVMFDGLPVTGPGGTPYELFEPLGLDYTEVLRGANAFDAGSVDLGGAINYVTKTGYTALPLLARYEFGSFGYQKEQLSSGAVVGPWDYYISFTNAYRSGYQDHTRATSTGVVANLGYRINADIDTRFYFRYRNTENLYPGDLTPNQIAQNPRQSVAPFNMIGFNATRIQPGSEWLGNKTTIHFDDESKLVIGEDWHNYPIDIREGPQEGVWGYDDFTESVQYTRNDLIFGRESDTDLGVFSTTHLNGYQNVTIRVPQDFTPVQPFGALVQRQTFEGSDNDLHLSSNTNIWKRLWLNLGGAVVYDTRAANVSIPVADTPTYHQDAANLVPRVGLVYAFTPDIRAFANLSRSIEPPNDWEFVGGNVATSGPLNGFPTSAIRLRNETATTAEIGTSGTLKREIWSVDYYHSAVHNELLSISTLQTQLTGFATYTNASPTTHQGVEASLTSVLWDARKWKVSLRQAYTFSQFNFSHDPVFGGNQLPGIPKNFYQGEIRVDLRDGLYGSFNTQVASGMPVDYANSVFSKAYQLIGATLGYDDDKNGRQVFLTLNNLENTHYAAIVEPTYSCHGVSSSCAFLQPGDGFGVFAGIQFGFR